MPLFNLSSRDRWLPPARVRLGGMLCLGLAAAAPARAQTPDPVAVSHEIFVGSQLEEYLRLLQTAGQTRLYPWSVRGFGAEEITSLEPRGRRHPWAGRYDFSADTTGALRFDWVRPSVRLIANSHIPYGYNDGPIWAGRGITAYASVGFAARYGPLSLVVAPEIFTAQNYPFSIITRGITDEQRFADPVSPTSIDLPQQFGDGAYSQLSPGQSTLRLDFAGVAAGISTANQQWGPVWDQPLILGNNAAGFPHAYIGTSGPVNIWIGDVHGRVVWGTLGQSDYAPEGDGSDRRFMAGMVAAFRPRGVPGLEIGGSRFFHRTWPDGGPGVDDFLWPFQSILKEGLPQTEGGDLSNADNQLASVFARWVLPGAGAEVYGEYAREDHSWNARDLALEPDHDSGYVLGLSKAWSAPADRIVSLRAEVMNAQVTHLDLVRPQTPLYRHSQQRQGHTHLGQILGAASGYAGASARLAVDLYHPGGRWGAGLTRSLRRVPLPRSTAAAELGQGADVIYGAEVSGTFFLGRFDLDAAITPVYEFNRNMGDDYVSLNLQMQVRASM